jgi:hypothetical protein
VEKDEREREREREREGRLQTRNDDPLRLLFAGARLKTYSLELSIIEIVAMLSIESTLGSKSLVSSLSLRLRVRLQASKEPSDQSEGFLLARAGKHYFPLFLPDFSNLELQRFINFEGNFQVSRAYLALLDT